MLKAGKQVYARLFTFGQVDQHTPPPFQRKGIGFLQIGPHITHNLPAGAWILKGRKIVQ
ncbi:hypothetical protein ADICEAN_01171 [Cesiribacter andamanensis AMV16]|uniref:Uncharacterized protein n=1 Tax=Cesiribacter andamanensis AMV16 TaxID=1279009 RepID=M7NPK6_9BACT|nr:hypothetical protein ADICEAN_01171 [Cesiribacter andamanensis AMV16]